jgi:hypothetical protein
VDVMRDKEFNYYISGETGKWEVVIGLEVHAKVSSNVSSLTKKYATFLFQSYNLDKEKDEFSK